MAAYVLLASNYSDVDNILETMSLSNVSKQTWHSLSCVLLVIGRSPASIVKKKRNNKPVPCFSRWLKQSPVCPNHMFQRVMQKLT